MSRKQRQTMIDRAYNQLSLVRQCILLDISRASLYLQLVEGAPGLFGTEQKSPEKAKDAQIDQLYRHIGQLKVERDFLAERSGL